MDFTFSPRQLAIAIAAAIPLAVSAAETPMVATDPTRVMWTRR